MEFLKKYLWTLLIPHLPTMFGKDVVVVFEKLTLGVVEVEPGSVGSVGRV